MSTATGRPRPFLVGVFRTACNYCVRSKRGCSGGSPCDQCQKRGKTCTYAQRRMSGPRGRPTGRSQRVRSRAKARSQHSRAAAAAAEAAGASEASTSVASDGPVIPRDASCTAPGVGVDGSPRRHQSSVSAPAAFAPAAAAAAAAAGLESGFASSSGDNGSDAGASHADEAATDVEWGFSATDMMDDTSDVVGSGTATAAAAAAAALSLGSSSVVESGPLSVGVDSGIPCTPVLSAASPPLIIRGASPIALPASSSTPAATAAPPPPPPTVSPLGMRAHRPTHVRRDSSSLSAILNGNLKAQEDDGDEDMVSAIHGWREWGQANAANAASMTAVAMHHHSLPQALPLPPGPQTRAVSEETTLAGYVMWDVPGQTELPRAVSLGSLSPVPRVPAGEHAKCFGHQQQQLLHFGHQQQQQPFASSMRDGQHPGGGDVGGPQGGGVLVGNGFNISHTRPQQLPHGDANQQHSNRRHQAKVLLLQQQQQQQRRVLCFKREQEQRQRQELQTRYRRQEQDEKEEKLQEQQKRLRQQQQQQRRVLCFKREQEQRQRQELQTRQRRQEQDEKEEKLQEQQKRRRQQQQQQQQHRVLCFKREQEQRQRQELQTRHQRQEQDQKEEKLQEQQKRRRQQQQQQQQQQSPLGALLLKDDSFDVETLDDPVPLVNNTSVTLRADYANGLLYNSPQDWRQKLADRAGPLSSLPGRPDSNIIPPFVGPTPNGVPDTPARFEDELPRAATTLSAASQQQSAMIFPSSRNAVEGGWSSPTAAAAATVPCALLPARLMKATTVTGSTTGSATSHGPMLGSADPLSDSPAAAAAGVPAATSTIPMDFDQCLTSVGSELWDEFVDLDCASLAEMRVPLTREASLMRAMEAVGTERVVGTAGAACDPALFSPVSW